MNERINEEIGALLDGRLESGPRTELLARLAASDDDFDVFADTAAVLREAEEGETAENEPAGVGTTSTEETPRSADVIPLRPRHASGWRSPAVRWLAAAALLAGVALVPLLRSRSSADAWRDLGRVGALASPSDAALPDDWRNSWRVTRGGGNVVGEDNGVISRIGARHVDLEVAARSGNFDQTAQIAREIDALLDNVGGGVAVAPLYQAVVDGAERRDPNLRSSVASARKALSTSFGDDPQGDYLALGGWTEAARLAAVRSDSAFFRRRESRDALDAAANLESLDDAGKAAVVRLRSVTQQREIRDWNPVTRDLDTLQRELAR